MKHFKILVCGGRDYTNRQTIHRTLDATLQKIRDEGYEHIKLIHGAARGADTFAEEWAKLRGISSTAYRANWNLYGKAAGVIRNEQMLDESPDLIVAFPGGRGTAHMMSIGRKAGVPVHEVE